MGRCDRCKKETLTHTGSWFSRETICVSCSREEAKHPDYEYAKAVEMEAVAEGNLNFPGVGWPGPDGRVPR